MSSWSLFWLNPCRVRCRSRWGHPSYQHAWFGQNKRFIAIREPFHGCTRYISRAKCQWPAVSDFWSWSVSGFLGKFGLSRFHLINVYISTFPHCLVVVSGSISSAGRMYEFSMHRNTLLGFLHIFWHKCHLWSSRFKISSCLFKICLGTYQPSCNLSQFLCVFVIRLVLYSLVVTSSTVYVNRL